MRVNFAGIAPGRYAVTAQHDEDGDGKLKTNFIGMPKEGVGISFTEFTYMLLQATDFLDTARVVAGLDFVVSTDGAIAHLAAGMGVRTCVLSVQDEHWCWTGWYPEAIPCPQREAGNWNGPMSDVASALLAVPAAA